MLNHVTFSNNDSKLNISDLPDGAVIFFTSSSDSDFCQKQLKGFEDKFNVFKENNVTILFASDVDSQTESSIFVKDLNNEILKLVPDLKDNSKIGENLIIFTKKGSDLTFSELKTLPENDYNWSETMSDWVDNFNDTKLGSDGMWKWGQIAQKTADYLCVDCGYVEEILKGQTFPICVLCLSGEVDGPSGPAQEYWEEV